MKRLTMTQATASLADYTRELQGPLIVTVRGKPVAALVPLEGVDLEALYVGTSPKFLDIIEQSRRSLEANGGISSEEMRRRFERGSALNRNRNAQANGPKRKGSRLKTKQRK